MHRPVPTVFILDTEADLPTIDGSAYRLVPIPQGQINASLVGQLLLFPPLPDLRTALLDAHRAAPTTRRWVLLSPEATFSSSIAGLCHGIIEHPTTPSRWDSTLNLALGGTGLVPIPSSFDSADLPALPDSVTELLGMLEGDTANMPTVGHTIEHDPALTASVLALANSAYYGLPRRVGSVVEAATHLGATTLRLAILTCQVFEMMNRDAGRRIQNRAHQRVTIARSLGRISDEAVTAALLMDVGSLLLSSLDASYVRRTKSISVADRITEDTKTWGLDRDLLGAELLARWQLPQSVVTAVAHGRTRYPHPSEGLTPRAVAWLSELLLRRKRPDPAWVRMMGLERVVAQITERGTPPTPKQRTSQRKAW